MARNSARSSIHSPAAVKKASTRNSAECTGLRAVITPSAATTRITAKNQKTPASNMDRSAVGGVRGAVAGDLLLVAVAYGEQHFLGVIEVAALLAVVLEDVRLDDRVHRAGLLAQAAEDALGEVDVVARGAARAVGALLGLDRDRERGAHGLAQLAGDTALLAVRVAAQGVQPPEARAHRRLLLGELHRDLAPEEVAPGDQQALRQLDQQEGPEKIPDALNHRRHRNISLPYRPRRLHPHGDHHQPDERRGYEHLPAQAHDLVVAVAREGGAEPKEQRHYDEDLAEEPRERRDRAEERDGAGGPPRPPGNQRGEPRKQEHVCELRRGKKLQGYSGEL